MAPIAEMSGPVRWAARRPSASTQHKRGIAGHVPAGPWYDLAWRMLDETTRSRLAHKGTAVASPVLALSNPSKMPGACFGITAGIACPGAVRTPDPDTGAGAICGACYADRGGSSYTWPVVKRAYLVRYYWALVSSRTAAGRALFVGDMVRLVSKNTTESDPYFRIHDSGDFFNPAYVGMWADIIARLPHITFWAPTRSYRLPGPRWAEAWALINALPNAIIRPSALHVDAPVPTIPEFAAGSGVSRASYTCPASSQGNACRDCRQCWDAAVPVLYHLH